MVDGAYMTSSEYGAVTSWARGMRAMDPNIQQVSNVDNWIRAVASAYVAAEATADVSSVEQFAEVVLNDARARIASAAGPLIHYVPCYVFDVPRRDAICIGPVELVSGGELAARIAGQSEGEPKWLSFYNTFVERRDVPNRHDAPDADFWRAKAIWQMSQYPWIAIVRIDGCEPAMSRQRANDAARLALAGLALHVQPRSCANISLVSDWARPTVTRFLSQRPGGHLFTGSENHKPQVTLTEEISEIRDSLQGYLHWLGELIQEAMSNPVSSSRVLRDSWLNALYWYQSGCMEPSDARATICFSTAFESLAEGIGVGPITELFELVLGTDRRRVIAPTLGWTLEQAVEEIYGAARSEVVHGGRFVIFREYRNARGIATELCRYLLLETQDRLHDYERRYGRRPEVDDKAVFLRCVAARRKSPSS